MAKTYSINPSAAVAALALLMAAGAHFSQPVHAQTSSAAGNVAAESVWVEIRGEDDKDIPALEEGWLLELPVRDGAWVNKGDLIAHIDDSEAQAALEIAEISYEGALKRAQDDIELRYAEKQAAVTETDWRQDLLANEQKQDAVPEITIRRKKLDFERSLLQIEKAKHDGVLAVYDAKTKLAEAKAAQMAIDRRMIRAPFDGFVETVHRHEYEWVKPGDPIVQLIRIEKLHVRGNVDSSNYDPHEISGRPVTVKVVLARGREETFSGRVVYCSQTVEKASGNYLVRAEIENRRDGDNWIVRPGLPAEMTIHTGASAVAAR